MVEQDRGPTGEESQDGIAGDDHAKTWDDLEGNTLLEEAKALARYVGRHGNGLFEGDAASSDKNDPCAELLVAIANATSSPSGESWTTLMDAYAKVSSVTYEKRGVNGRSVLDTADAGLGTVSYRPFWIGVALFAIALVVHAMPHLLSDGSVLTLMKVLNPFLVPALWGGVGACTFLAKHLSNRLADQAYERVRQQGDTVRIFLGAMIGVFAVVVLTDFGSSAGDLSDTSTAEPASIAMSAVVIAFASGLAVKPIYAAIETLANALASRFSGN